MYEMIRIQLDEFPAVQFEVKHKDLADWCEVMQLYYTEVRDPGYLYEFIDQEGLFVATGVIA